MSNFDEVLSNVATVLAVSVLIDERLRDVEMIEFSHSIMTINQRIRPGVILTRRNIVNWFNANRTDIAEKISIDKNDIWKTQILGQIQGDELRRMVLACMFSISVCDYELNDEECDFLKLAVSHWETGLPHVQDMELMVG